MDWNILAEITVFFLIIWGSVHAFSLKLLKSMCGKLNKGRNVATPAYDGKPMKCEGLVDEESFKGEDELILVVWDPCVLL